MGQDVTEIETKNKGLQVAAINQKLLLSEIETILHSLEIPSWVVDTLNVANLDDQDELERVDAAALKLKLILHTRFEDGMEKLAAVQERVQGFNKIAVDFAKRFASHIKSKLASQIEASNAADKRKPPAGSMSRMVAHDTVTKLLKPYFELIKWLKDMEPRKHQEIQMASPIIRFESLLNFNMPQAGLHSIYEQTLSKGIHQFSRESSWYAFEKVKGRRARIWYVEGFFLTLSDSNFFFVSLHHDSAHGYNCAENGNGD